MLKKKKGNESTQKVLTSQDIVADESVEKIGFFYTFSKLFKGFFCGEFFYDL